jgi:hypothetical protein
MFSGHLDISGRGSSFRSSRRSLSRLNSVGVVHESVKFIVELFGCLGLL